MGSGVFGGLATLTQSPALGQSPPQSQSQNQVPAPALAQTQAAPLQALPADRIPVGALLLSRPANARQLKRVVEQEILPAIEEGRFSPEQARAFIRAQQKRLHLWNPNGTNEFNRLLWRRDIRG